jgi:enamine deaminase RidA (YjgF/YER057c/UK114 family)
LRTGPRILISGTAPIGMDGETVGAGDAYEQAHRCLEIVSEALEQLGGRRADVVRTRVFLTRAEDWEEVARAHGDVFGEVLPVSTFVVVKALLDPDWLVEIEAEAVAGEQDDEALPVRTACATQDQIEAVWRARWGIPIVSAQRSYEVADVEGLTLAGEGDSPLALVTYAVSDDEAELVSIDSFVEGRGYGSHLLATAERHLKGRGVRCLRLVTTNDNLAALRFYLRRGYRLIRLHLDALDRVREVKPEVPAEGFDGIALRDMWELTKVL